MKEVEVNLKRYFLPRWHNRRDNRVSSLIRKGVFTKLMGALAREQELLPVLVDVRDGSLEKNFFLFVCLVKNPDGNFMVVSLLNLPRLESCGLDDLVATFKVELGCVLLEETKEAPSS